jgi:hypothetical protein
MIKELVLFIAYRTTEEIMNPWLARFSQYGRVKLFIGTITVFNTAVILLGVNALFFQRKIHLSAGALISLCFIIPLFLLIIGLILKKSTLARSIRIYKGSKIAEIGGAVGLFYFLLNLSVIIFLLVKMSKYTIVLTI